MSILRKTALAAAVFLGVVSISNAATFTFDGVVSSSPTLTPTGPVFPAIGDAAVITVEIDDSNPGVSLDPTSTPPFSAPIVQVSLEVPGVISGSLPFGAFDDSFGFPGDPGLTFGSDGFIFTGFGPYIVEDPGTDFFGALESFQTLIFDYGTGATAPTTVGELVEAIGAPGFSGSYGWTADGEDSGLSIVSVAFSDSVSVPAIPLPAGGWLLLTGLLGLLRLSRAK